MENNTTITVADIQDLVRKAACATGSQAVYLVKAFRPAKNALIHKEDLSLWQALHDSLAKIKTLARYARRMEQYGNALLGYAESWDIDGNPIPHESRSADILIWNKKTKKFELARHAKEELVYLRKHPHNVPFIGFQIGKLEKTGAEAKQSALADKAGKAGKAIKKLVNELTKIDNGNISGKLAAEIMFAISLIPPAIQTPYVRHMVAAHEAAVGADLANMVAAEVAKNPTKTGKGKGKGKGKETQE